MMLTEVLDHFGLARDVLLAGYFETGHHRQLIKEVRAAILTGRLIAVSGVVGSGKTMLLRRLQEELVREGKIIVAKSLSVDKDRTTIPTLITALFHDLSQTRNQKFQAKVRSGSANYNNSSGVAVNPSHSSWTKRMICMARRSLD